MEKKYPIGGYAPGNYHNRCCTCERSFFGDKRAVQCEPCAVASLRELLKPYDQSPADAETGKEDDWRTFTTKQQQVIDLSIPQSPSPIGLVWVKGAPKEMAPHYAKVPSKIYDHLTYKAIIIPKATPGHWWAVGDGFAFDLKSEEIIEHLDESLPQPEREEWISVDDRLPTEDGRYWCYVEEITDLGRGYFQWNCAYNQNGKLFTDKSLCNGERITHWRPLPEPPKKNK